jgi:hypothetical protein
MTLRRSPLLFAREIDYSIGVDLKGTRLSILVT